MDREQMKRLLLLLALLALAGCSGDQGGRIGGAIALKITNAASFDPGAEHGRIDKYRVTVSGEGMDVPVVAEFPGEATEGTVMDVPAGGDRIVSVEALNPNEVSIRAGEAEGVDVGGGTTEVSIEMEAVPIFTNIRDGATIDNTRLVFKIFSDPANPVIVEERFKESSALLADASTNAAELYLDEATGLGRLAPKLMEPGRRAFAVVDLVTGRSHEVGVMLLDGTGRKPARFVSAMNAGHRLYGCVAPWCAP